MAESYNSESAASEGGVLRVPMRHEIRANKRQPMIASSPMYQTTRASLLSSERIAAQQQSGGFRVNLHALNIRSLKTWWRGLVDSLWRSQRPCIQPCPGPVFRFMQQVRNCSRMSRRESSVRPLLRAAQDAWVSPPKRLRLPTVVSASGTAAKPSTAKPSTAKPSTAKPSLNNCSHASTSAHRSADAGLRHPGDHQ